MKNKYLVFNTKVMFAFLISGILFISCSKDQSDQEFSKQQDPETTSTTLASDDVRAFATAAVTYNIFPSTSGGTTQSAPPREVGVKFRVTQPGYITGVRFYKGAGTGGTHIGHLWSSTGTKLAEATFTNETASGWQQVSFTTPIAVTTGKTYVASYFTSSGYHTITASYFGSAVVNGPLRALATGEDGGNGVYKNSTASAFPNIPSGLSSNFWVDVVFSTDASQPIVVPSPTAPSVAGIKYLLLPKGTPQTYNNKSNLVIENLSFTNPSGNILNLNNCTNVIIRNCYFGASSGEAISIYQGSNITIEKCLFANNRTMVYAVQTTGNIKVLNNQFVNIKGPYPRGQFVQFNTCTGAGNLVQGNKGENFEGRSAPLDIISVFSSKGTAASPITVKDNIFRGGGPNNSGGGILGGDYGGQWVLIENNKLINPGQYGIAVAGGYNITLKGNQIYAVKKPWNNVGMFVWGQAGASCGNIIVTNNRVNYMDKSGVPNNWWDGGNCSASSYSNPTSITLAEMNVPAHLISFITEIELLTLK